MAFWGTSEEDVQKMLTQFEAGIFSALNDRSEKIEADFRKIWEYIQHDLETEISNIDARVKDLQGELNQTKLEVIQKLERAIHLVDSLKDHWEENPLTERLDDYLSRALKEVLDTQKQLGGFASTMMDLEDRFLQLNNQRESIRKEVEEIRLTVKELVETKEVEPIDQNDDQALEFLHSATFLNRLRWLLTGHLPKTPVKDEE